MKRNNKKGFTLAELLIVVAIIAVLVAIAIPVFTAQLEKAREGVDAANIRAAYAECMADAITGDAKAAGYPVVLKQEVTGWKNTFDFPAGLAAGTTEPAKGGTATLTWDATNNRVNCSITLKPATS